MDAELMEGGRMKRLVMRARRLPWAASAGQAQPVRVAVVPDAVSITAVIEAAHLAEPLVAAGPTTPQEDLALARAVTAHEQRARPEDVRNLTAFLAAYPHSGWAAAL